MKLKNNNLIKKTQKDLQIKKLEEMSLVPVNQEKNLNTVVVLYKNNKEIAKVKIIKQVKI